MNRTSLACKPGQDRSTVRTFNVISQERRQKSLCQHAQSCITPVCAEHPSLWEWVLTVLCPGVVDTARHKSVVFCEGCSPSSNPDLQVLLCRSVLHSSKLLVLGLPLKCKDGSMLKLGRAQTGV
eukprot:368436-Amphidinium_carterae.1